MSDEQNNDADRELRNAIFSAQKAVEQSSGPNSEFVKSREQVAKQDFDMDIPVDMVPLPSQGLVYPNDHPLHNAVSVEYRAMTAREEDILMSQALIKKGTVLNEHIRACVLDKSLDVTSLLSGDRNALMIAIRASGYGAEYTPVYTCPTCNHKNKLEVDLTSLGIKALELEPVEPGINEFAFKLPLCKKTVHFKFLTSSDEEEILKEANAKKRKGLLNSNLVTSRLIHSIVSVEGLENKAKLVKFVSFMRAADSLALRRYIDDNEPGVDMEVDFQCLACDDGGAVQLPMGPSFFWPNAQG